MSLPLKSNNGCSLVKGNLYIFVTIIQSTQRRSEVESADKQTWIMLLLQWSIRIFSASWLVGRTVGRPSSLYFFAFCRKKGTLCTKWYYYQTRTKPNEWLIEWGNVLIKFAMVTYDLVSFTSSKWMVILIQCKQVMFAGNMFLVQCCFHRSAIKAFFCVPTHNVL